MILRGNNTKFHKMREYRVVSLGTSDYTGRSLKIQSIVEEHLHTNT